MGTGDRVTPKRAVHGRRPWTVEEANQRLPSLQELLPDLRAWIGRLRRVHAERRRLAEFWGKEFAAADQPDRALRERLEDEEQALTRRLEEAMDELDQDGIEVKDIDSGLLDFRSVREGEPILLCWQRGEESVAFYHTPEGGFRSRRPISEAAEARSPPPDL